MGTLKVPEGRGGRAGVEVSSMSLLVDFLFSSVL